MPYRAVNNLLANLDGRSISRDHASVLYCSSGANTRIDVTRNLWISVERGFLDFFSGKTGRFYRIHAILSSFFCFNERTVCPRSEWSPHSAFSGRWVLQSKRSLTKVSTRQNVSPLQWSIIPKIRGSMVPIFRRFEESIF